MARVLVKEKLFEAVNYKPHLHQRAIHASTARNRVNVAGRRFGKSDLGGHELLPEAMYAYYNRAALEEAGKRREFWIVGPEYTDSEKEFRYFYDAAKRLKLPFDHPGTYNDPHGGDMKVSLWGGRFILIAKSAKHPESLVGEGLNGVIMAEAAKMKESVWTKFVRPMLADYQGWSLFNTSPEGKNWVYKLYMAGKDPARPDWASWRNPSWHNPHVFPRGATTAAIDAVREIIADGRMVTPEDMEMLGIDPEVVSMLQDMSDELFNQEVAALFTEFVGRVFKAFDEDTHVTDLTYNPDLPLYGAVDYGWSNPFVWLDVQVDAWGNVYVINEYYRQHKDTAECAEEMLRLAPYRAKAVAFYPDPAEPDDTHTLSKALRVRAGTTSTGGPLKTRLELIRRALKVDNLHLPAGHELRVPKLLIDRRCTELIREMNDYRYPESRTEAQRNPRNAPEAPLDKDNHGPEALGRFFLGHFGPPVRGRNRVRKAAMTR